jgi:hypothetical protein
MTDRKICCAVISRPAARWLGLLSWRTYIRPMPARKLPDPNAKPKKPGPLDGLPQIERFKAVARDLEWDEDSAAFEAALQRIARHKPASIQRWLGCSKQPNFL